MNKTQTKGSKLSYWFNNIININKLVNYFANLFADVQKNKADTEARLAKLNSRIKFLEDVFVEQQLVELKEALEQIVFEDTPKKVTKKSKSSKVKKSNKK